MKTYQAKNGDIERKWYLIDATDVPLGRLATQVANMLRGKDKPTYTAHVDTGGFVVVVNARKVKLTGRKLTEKFYYRHSQTPGGLTAVSAEKMLEKHPDRVVSHAVKGMLPKNLLARRQITKLKIYPGAEHPHAAQKPVKVEVRG